MISILYIIDNFVLKQESDHFSIHFQVLNCLDITSHFKRFFPCKIVFARSFFVKYAFLFILKFNCICQKLIFARIYKSICIYKVNEKDYCLNLSQITPLFWTFVVILQNRPFVCKWNLKRRLKRWSIWSTLQIDFSFKTLILNRFQKLKKCIDFCLLWIRKHWVLNSHKNIRHSSCK